MFISPFGCSWSPTLTFAPYASIAPHSYCSAAGRLKPPNSPHVLWNLPVMPRKSHFCVIA